MKFLAANEIRLHLCNGQKHTYFQDELSLLENIHNDSDPDIFRRQGIIRNRNKVISNYKGKEIIGVILRPECPFDYFFERERSLGVVVTEIGCESANRTPHDYVPAREELFGAVKPIVNNRIAIFTELEFESGLKVFLEFSQVPETSIDELAITSHIFSHSSLCCRRLGGGLSIWNTDHILRWTNFSRPDLNRELSDPGEIRSESKTSNSSTATVSLI